MIGAVEGYHFAGELENIWKKGLLENRLCGCGRPLRSCPFWHEVFEYAFGGWNQIDASSLERQRWQIARKSSLLKFGLIGDRASMDVRGDPYFETMRKLVHAIQVVSGCETVLDSSGSTSQARVLLSTPDWSVKLLHLVRDPRGVAVSMMKSKNHQEAFQGKSYSMVTTSPLRSGLQWVIRNLGLEWISRRADEYTRIRYEDFIAEPQRTLLNLTASEVPLRQEDGSWVFMPPENHSASANPVRFEREAIDLRLDNAWNTELAVTQKALATLITSPLLKRYGYRLGGSSG